MEDASTLLRMEGSVFHIIIIEQCLLGVNAFELLRIGREIDFPVIGKYSMCVCVCVCVCVSWICMSFSVSLTIL